MHRSILAAAVLAASPTIALAITAASTPAINNLSLGDYTFGVSNFDVASETTFSFVADDVARSVEAVILAYDDEDMDRDLVIEINGTAATIGTPVTIDLAQAGSFDIFFGLPSGAGSIKLVSTSFEVTSSPAPIPVPAALPLVATGVGALALMRRKRKAG